ncbi:hypothetical protein MKX01_035682, partial [Papaver californicum]
EQQQQRRRKSCKRRHKKKSLVDTTSKDQCQTHPEQQESTIKQLSTEQQRVAKYIRDCKKNCIQVAKLSADGIIEHS